MHGFEFPSAAQQPPATASLQFSWKMVENLATTKKPFSLTQYYGSRMKTVAERCYSPEKALEEVLLRPPAVDARVGHAAQREHLPGGDAVRPGANCINIGLPGK